MFENHFFFLRCSIKVRSAIRSNGHKSESKEDHARIQKSSVSTRIGRVDIFSAHSRKTDNRQETILIRNKRRAESIKTFDKNQHSSTGRADRRNCWRRVTFEHNKYESLGLRRRKRRHEFVLDKKKKILKKYSVNTAITKRVVSVLILNSILLNSNDWRYFKGVSSSESGSFVDFCLGDKTTRRVDEFFHVFSDKSWPLNPIFFHRKKNTKQHG